MDLGVGVDFDTTCDQKHVKIELKCSQNYIKMKLICKKVFCEQYFIHLVEDIYLITILV